MTAHGITRSIQQRASLAEPTPLIGPEQAAADRAAFMQRCKDPEYRMSRGERIRAALKKTDEEIETLRRQQWPHSN